MRWFVLTVLSVLGAVLFLPFLKAVARGGISLGQESVFTIIVTVLSALSIWAGLRFADQAGLPMPLLRRIEGVSPVVADTRHSASEALLSAVILGLIFGLGGAVFLHILHAPPLPGSLPARLASSLFAAVNLESVIHLLIMSATVRFTRRVWLGVAVAAVAFVAFHASGVAGLPAPVIMASLTVNGAIGILLGVMYARYGIEAVMLAHAVAHLLTVGLG
jgi:hypothetical protein